MLYYNQDKRQGQSLKNQKRSNKKCELYLQKKTFKNLKRQLTDAETVKKFLLSVIDGTGTFKEIVITENNITIKTVIR